MYEGKILTAEHFYFQRSINDVKFILKIFKKFFKTDKILYQSFKNKTQFVILEL